MITKIFVNIYDNWHIVRKIGRIFSSILGVIILLSFVSYNIQVYYGIGYFGSFFYG